MDNPTILPDIRLVQIRLTNGLLAVKEIHTQWQQAMMVLYGRDWANAHLLLDATVYYGMDMCGWRLGQVQILYVIVEMERNGNLHLPD
jgi:hypothetical protein